MNQESIPPPLSRYIRRALGSQNIPIKLAQLQQEGELRIGLTPGRWLPFIAEEIVKPMDVAFEWKARVKLAPLIHIRVQDAYEHGEGTGKIKLMSALTVAKERGGVDLNLGSLFRFLAEAPWYPSILWPSEKLHWKQIDHSRVAATLKYRDLNVEVEFRFNPSGDVATIYTPARPRKVATGYEMAAWEGHFSDYAERDGLRVPLRGEVGWYTSDLWSCVWRGRITGAKYQF